MRTSLVIGVVAASSDTDAPNMVNVFTAEEFARRNIEWNSDPAFDGTDPHRIPVPDDAQPGATPGRFSPRRHGPSLRPG